LKLKKKTKRNVEKEEVKKKMGAAIRGFSSGTQWRRNAEKKRGGDFHQSGKTHDPDTS